eukprot:36667-Hanusia_phi.AAC.2
MVQRAAVSCLPPQLIHSSLSYSPPGPVPYLYIGELLLRAQIPRWIAAAGRDASAACNRRWYMLDSCLRCLSRGSGELAAIGKLKLSDVLGL